MKKHAENILKLITKKDKDGISESEIEQMLKLRKSTVRNAVKNLFNGRLIFRHHSTNKWKLIKYRELQDMQHDQNYAWTIAS